MQGYAGVAEVEPRSFVKWEPICCKQQMHQLVRRAILRADGSVVYCAVWSCANCGRLLL